MPVEIKILSGARAGQLQRFEQQAVIVVGRHQQSDLRFDPKQDLDVSGRHAEFRGVDGKYDLFDHGSTNGTYVNGKKIAGSAPVADGDVITFGAKGPQVEFRAWGEGADAPRISKRSTEARIALAVEKQTKGMQRYLIAALGLVVVGVAAAFYFGKLASEGQIETLRKQIAANDSMRIMLQGQLGAGGDTAFANKVTRDIGDLETRLGAANTDQERDSLRSKIAALQTQLRGTVQMGAPEIFKRNAGAVAMLIMDYGDKGASGTGFSVSKEGLIVTNAHNIKDVETGKLAVRIAVKFANDTNWFPASIVKVSPNHEELDLALLKMDRPMEYPAVSGVVAAPTDATEGHSIVAIGFPLGYSLPQEGTGNNAMAKASLNPGTVSKKTTSILQMDSFAAHGSSGSPVFSTSGFVVGVVYGGPPGVGGKIVYAVPSERVAAFIPDSLKAGIIK